MRILRKRSPEPPPQRRPHPDARIETELQRILSLRKAIARKEALLDGDQAQLATLRATVAKHPTWDGHYLRQRQIETLLAEIAPLEAEVAKLHDEIAERVGRIDDADLTYLDRWG